MICKITDVEIGDGDQISRQVEFPAMKSGPLFRKTFPRYEDLSTTETDDVICWYTDMLEEAFYDQRESFLKAIDVDGNIIGFCGWSVIPIQNLQDQKKSQSKTNQRAPLRVKPQNWLPDTLDVDSWISVSNTLREERDRVLNSLQNITRLTFMAVSPSHQRQGIGSAMMQRICDETDEHGRYAYVLAAPAGVPLYTKFGFEVVGNVETSEGIIISMLRKSQKQVVKTRV